MRGSTEKWCHRRRAFQKGFGELTDDVRVVGAIVNVVLLGPSLQAKRRGTGLKPSAENRPGASQIPRTAFSCCDFFASSGDDWQCTFRGKSPRPQRRWHPPSPHCNSCGRCCAKRTVRYGGHVHEPRDARARWLCPADGLKRDIVDRAAARPSLLRWACVCGHCAEACHTWRGCSRNANQNAS